MLRLPVFEVVAPTTVAGVVDALAVPGARLLAGGTDLLPNLKHRLDHPSRLVSLHAVEGLRGIVEADGEIRIGAGVTLAELAADARVRRHLPSLAKAAGLVAGPQIRNAGTVGGNVNLDTRCRYVNQTAFWREAIGGGCLKSEGDVCHVVPGGQRCVAALSSDCVPVLISLDARIALVGPDGERELSLDDYYHPDGIAHTRREAGELTTELRVPLPAGPRRTDYVKWRPRGAIDFPLVSVALRFDLNEAGAITAHRVVAGVLGARPKVVSRLDAVVGRSASDPAVPALVAEACYRQCKPLENVPYEAPYRRQLLRVLVRRAVEALAGDDG